MNRFIYVAAPRGRVKHILRSMITVEGQRTDCGIITEPKWLWWNASSKPKLPRCKRCERAPD